jgi:hypothetical protein
MGLEMNPDEAWPQGVGTFACRRSVVCISATVQYLGTVIVIGYGGRDAP